MLLSDLVDDVLDLVLSRKCSSYLIVNLWKCGNHALNSRLAHGGCTEVYLTDTRSFSTSRFPKLLLSLRRLRVLNINRGFAYLMPVYDLSKTLPLLYPSLETLDLRCSGAISCLLNWSSDPSSNLLKLHDTPNKDIKLEDLSSSGIISTDYPRGTSQYWNIGAAFPSLNSLTITETSPIAFVSAEDFAALPESLEDLSIGRGNFEICSLLGPVKLSVLPPNITRCNLGSVKVDLEDLRSLPPSLTDVGCVEFGQSIFAFIPSTVKKVFHYQKPFAEYLHEMTNSFPQTLEKLQIVVPPQATTAPAWLETLSPTLTELIICPPSTPSMRMSYVRLLPRSLTSLRMGNFELAEEGLNQTSKPFYDWPPNLTKLIMDRSVAPRNYDWSVLPPKVKDFEFYGLRFLEAPPEEMGLFGTLPRSITRLYLSFEVQKSAGYTIERHLPPKLTTLSMPSIHPASFPFLPETLERLKLTLNCLSSASAPYIMPLIEIDPVDAIASLPRSLRTLEMSLPPNAFKQLPRGLTELSVSHHMNGVANRVNIANLPRTLLKWVSRDSSIVFEEGAFEGGSLPPNLQVLTAIKQSSASFIPPKDLALLPPSLVSLSIGVLDLKPEHLATLPCRHNLQEFFITGPVAPGKHDNFLARFKLNSVDSKYPLDPNLFAVWPENTLNQFCFQYDKETWKENQMRKQKQALLEERSRLYPDPRVILSLEDKAS